MSNLANVDTLDKMCPACNGDMLLLMDEYVCSVCGLRLNRWFDPDRPLVERAREFHMKLRKVIEESEGGKGPKEESPPDFLKGIPSSSTTGALGLPKLSEYEHEVPEHLDEEDPALPSPIVRKVVPGPLAPFTLTEHDLRRLMMGSCPSEESAPEGLSYRFDRDPGSAEQCTHSYLASSSSVRCFPETQLELCPYYNVETHVCKEDGTAWCLNPAAPICWTRIDVERAKKSWPVYKGSQWKNNSECPVCGAEVNYEIASCETGCNYCCDEHATQHVKEETPEGGW